MRICNFSNDGFVLYITNLTLYFVGYARVFRPYNTNSRYIPDSEIVLITSSYLYIPKKLLSWKIVERIILINAVFRLSAKFYRKEHLENGTLESGIYTMGECMLNNYETTIH